jgi:hypothetical protein
LLLTVILQSVFVIGDILVYFLRYETLFLFSKYEFLIFSFVKFVLVFQTIPLASRLKFFISINIFKQKFRDNFYLFVIEYYLQNQVVAILGVNKFVCFTNKFVFLFFELPIVFISLDFPLILKLLKHLFFSFFSYKH